MRQRSMGGFGIYKAPYVAMWEPIRHHMWQCENQFSRSLAHPPIDSWHSRPGLSRSQLSKVVFSRFSHSHMPHQDILTFKFSHCNNVGTLFSRCNIVPHLKFSHCNNVRIMFSHCNIAQFMAKIFSHLVPCNKKSENDPKTQKKSPDTNFFNTGRNFGTFYNYRSLDAIFGLFELGEIVASAFWNFWGGSQNGPKKFLAPMDSRRVVLSRHISPKTVT